MFQPIRTYHVIVSTYSTSVPWSRDESRLSIHIMWSISQSRDVQSRKLKTIKYSVRDKRDRYDRCSRNERTILKLDRSPGSKPWASWITRYSLPCEACFWSISDTPGLWCETLYSRRRSVVVNLVWQLLLPRLLYRINSWSTTTCRHQTDDRLVFAKQQKMTEKGTDPTDHQDTKSKSLGE